jgi:lysophospholipase L1-like esterase
MNSKFVAVALAMVLAFVVVLPATPTAAKSGNSVYLALGDSLAQGYGATDPTQTAYVPHLFGFFRGESHGGVSTLTNLAVGGETSASFITGGQLQSALTTIATNDVGVVTFDIGGNDLLELMSGPCQDPTDPGCLPAVQAAMATFAQNYAFSVATLDAALSQEPGDPPLIVMTYYNPWSGTGSTYEGVLEMVLLGSDGELNCTNPAGWGMNDLIACLGPQYGADAVADVYPPFTGKGLTLTHIATGDIHPNNAGYAQIASVFREAYRDR